MTSPRSLIAVGLTCWVLIGGLFILLFLFDANPGAFAAGIGAELASGREGGIPVGLAAGAHPIMVWLGSFLQDLGTAFIGFPMFLWFIHKYHEKDWYLMRKLRRMEAKASSHQAFVDRWGPIGIGAFMMVPFLVNGPFVGLILGRISGIPTQKLLPVVVASTILTAALWTFFFDAMLNLVARVDSRLGLWFALGALGVVLLLGAIDFAKEHKALTDEEE